MATGTDGQGQPEIIIALCSLIQKIEMEANATGTGERRFRFQSQPR
jgi:hypothetical protein